MSFRVALAASLLAVAAGCGSQSPRPGDGDGSAAGLHGHVVISPATPVCRAGATCSKPARHLSLVFSRHGSAVATRTDGRGDYRIRLAPGRYAVRVPTARGAARLHPTAATVPNGRFARIAFTYDPGIR